MLPLLYSYRRCPYAMRARMALLQAGRRFRIHEIVLRDKPAELLALSPKGTVPVLQQSDGTVLEQSWDIMHWALAPADADGFWQRAQSAENLALLGINDGEFKHHLDRYKYPDRYPDETADRDRHRERAVATLLAPLQQRLQGQAYLGGDSPCASDLALFPFVRQFAAVQPDWFGDAAQRAQWPALQRWLAQWLGSTLFAACMVKLPVGQAVEFPLPDDQHSD